MTKDLYFLLPPVPASTEDLVRFVLFFLSPVFALGLLVGLLVGRIRGRGATGLPGRDL